MTENPVILQSPNSKGYTRFKLKKPSTWRTARKGVVFMHTTIDNIDMCLPTIGSIYSMNEKYPVTLQSSNSKGCTRFKQKLPSPYRYNKKKA